LGARTKLNAAAINGSLALAALVGYFFGSWTVFAVVAVALIGLALHSGDIRPGPRQR